MNNEASFEFADNRVRDYLESFDTVWQICTSFGDLEPLDDLEKRYPIFADLSWDLFEPGVVV